MKQKIERLFKYIVHGIPNTIIEKKLTYVTQDKCLLGKKILITGGNSGIGFEIAEKCIEFGAKVVIVGSNVETLEKSRLKLGDECDSIKCDLSILEELTGLVTCIKNNDFDILVNNAGVSFHEKSCFNVDYDGFQKQFDINLRAPYFLSIAFCEQLIAQKKGGNILNIVSERGLYCDDLPYGLTKCALIDFTKGLSRKVIKNNIRVNAIAPGVTATRMTGYNENNNLFNEYTCGNRLFLPSEIGQVAVYLISDYFDCISGEVIACNQGNHLRSNHV